MTKTPDKGPRYVLHETATSIKELILRLENREVAGRPITAIEIQSVANQLHLHVENLLAVSRSLRDEQPES